MAAAETRPRRDGNPSEITASSASRSSTFSVPEPIKRLFDRFPLVIYAANDLPERALKLASHHVLYIFTTDKAAKRNEPSFNPTCLKWQTYLKFAGVKFDTKSSNNHASPTGSLPFLIPGTMTDRNQIEPVSSTRIPRWVKEQGGTVQEPQSLRYEAYLSLIEYRIRCAWLYSLYMDEENFKALTHKLYILPCSSNQLVQTVLGSQLQHAAEEELRKHVNVIDGDEINLEAKLAFEALSHLLGQDEYFFGATEPGLFDANVFAYTHLLLNESFGWKNGHLSRHLRENQNLVDHRERILAKYFNQD